MGKKSVTVTNEKVSSYIYDDIVFSILSKLPLKSLKRFECVCKSWSLLFENLCFTNMVRNNILSKDLSCCHNTSLLLQRRLPNTYVKDLCFLSGDTFENRIKLDCPNPFQEDTETPYHVYRFDIFDTGSVNDFICVYYLLRDNINVDVRVVVWNPTTEECRVIPRSPDEFQPCAANACHDVINFLSFGQFHGFGYDRVTNDYKVISHRTFLAPQLETRRGYVPLGDISLEPLWEIYSLRSNSWRKLDLDMPASYGITKDARVYLDGVCHWWYFNIYESYLVSFDLGNEVFFTTPIPSDIGYNSFDEGYLWRHLVVLNGSIAAITYHKTTFNISILGEFSVKESWTKLFTVGSLPCVERPFGVKKGRIFFKRKDEELVWFDLSTQMIEELGVKGEGHLSRIIVYKKNFLPIGGMKK